MRRCVQPRRLYSAELSRQLRLGFRLYEQSLSSVLWFLSQCHGTISVSTDTLPTNTAVHQSHADISLPWGVTRESVSTSADPYSVESCFVFSPPSHSHSLVSLRRLRYIQLSQKSYPSSLPSFPYGVETTDPVILKTKEILRVMDVYAREWITLPTSSLPCHNVRPECAYWAASSDACRTNTQYMMQECPLVCLACQYRHIFDTCHARASAYHASVSPLSTDQLQRIRRRLMERDQTTNVLASSSSKMDIWAYRIDRFLPDSDRNELSESLSKQWQPSSTYGFDVNGTTWPNHVMMDYTLSHDLRRASSSAYLVSCLNDDLASTKKYSSAACKTLYNLQSKMAQELGVPIEHIEKPIEFVRHREGQSFAKHHDYRYVDEWKAGGPRILTAYLQLSGSKDSNGDSITTEIGFPDVDWTIVPVETGQLLLWPNVASEGDATNAEPRVVPHQYMSSEVLAPKDGTVLGLYIHVRMYPVRPEVDDSSMPEDCH